MINKYQEVSHFSRRDFLKLIPLLISSPALSACGSTQETQSIEHMKEKSLELFQRAGLVTLPGGALYYADPLNTPSKIYNSHQNINTDTSYNTQMAAVWTNSNGEKKATSLLKNGEPIHFEEGTDGKPSQIDLAHKAEEKNTGVQIFEFDTIKSKYKIIFYGETNPELKKIIDKNKGKFENLLFNLFAFSASSENILHIGQSGMPTNPQSISNKAISPNLFGLSNLFWDSDTKIPEQSNIFISLAHADFEAKKLEIPLISRIMGILANEAHGISLMTICLLSGLPFPDQEIENGLRGEGSSTIIDLATMLATMTNIDSPFAGTNDISILNNFFNKAILK